MSNRTVAWLLTFLMTVAFISLYGNTLSQPDLCHFDEFLTLNRTQGILETGELLNIYTNGVLTLIKPPLHYYLGAILIHLGLEPIVALRLLSVLFTALALYVLAAFTASLAPEKPYAIPTAVCLLLSSLHFAKFSRAAMLEMGYVFFILLAFYGAFRAAEDPRYWIVWALGCGLGTLHKVPMALGLSSLWILALRYTGHLKGESRFWREN